MAYRIRADVDQLAPYRPGKPIDELRRETGADPISKLASNENPLGPSPKAIAAIIESAAAVHRYPDAVAHDLVQALSFRLGIEAESFAVGNGSDELIQYLASSLLGASDSAVIPSPSFPRYGAATRTAGAAPLFAALRDGVFVDPDALIEKAMPNTRIFWVANPNNPTGTVMAKSEFDRLIAKVPSGSVIVLDEAYFEFVDEEVRLNAVDYVLQGAPVVGLRTLSKTYGLAGLRIGYAFGPAEIMSAVNRVRCPFNVNALAQAAAIAALEDEQYLRDSIAFNRDSRETLRAILENFGFRCAPSQTNFIWADFGKPVAEVCEKLLARGVIVRSGDVFGCPNCVRVSVGTPEELSHLERALGEAVS